MPATRWAARSASAAMVSHIPTTGRAVTTDTPRLPASALSAMRRIARASLGDPSGGPGPPIPAIAATVRFSAPYRAAATRWAMSLAGSVMASKSTATARTAARNESASAQPLDGSAGVQPLDRSLPTQPPTINQRPANTQNASPCGRPDHAASECRDCIGRLDRRGRPSTRRREADNLDRTSYAVLLADSACNTRAIVWRAAARFGWLRGDRHIEGPPAPTSPTPAHASPSVRRGADEIISYRCRSDRGSAHRSADQGHLHVPSARIRGISSASPDGSAHRSDIAPLRLHRLGQNRQFRTAA